MNKNIESYSLFNKFRLNELTASHKYLKHNVFVSPFACNIFEVELIVSAQEKLFNPKFIYEFLKKNLKRKGRLDIFVKTTEKVRKNAIFIFVPNRIPEVTIVLNNCNICNFSLFKSLSNLNIGNLHIEYSDTELYQNGSVLYDSVTFNTHLTYGFKSPIFINNLSFFNKKNLKHLNLINKDIFEPVTFEKNPWSKCQFTKLFHHFETNVTYLHNYVGRNRTSNEEAVRRLAWDLLS